jgi:hypothetical protein
MIQGKQMLKRLSVLYAFIGMIIGGIMIISGTEHRNTHHMLPGAILAGLSILAHAVASRGGSDNDSFKNAPRG